MGHVNAVQDVKLFAGITFQDERTLANVQQLLEHRFGEIDMQSPIFDFTFTTYYAVEMGAALQKVFWSFSLLIPPEKLVDAKLFSNNIEARFATHDGKRTINIDPGYLSNGNIVLATTKNFAHRVYLGKGIYGDMHMIFRHNQFHPLEWTYPDYSQPLAMDFFLKIREIYRTTSKGRK
ncbi:DUF4416 family protein [candidate division KSB1 bacterium]|nr:DUF4416 family protein [candidate division KSB1 bacterium]